MVAPPAWASISRYVLCSDVYVALPRLVLPEIDPVHARVTDAVGLTLTLSFAIRFASVESVCDAYIVLDPLLQDPALRKIGSDFVAGVGAFVLKVAVLLLLDTLDPVALDQVGSPMDTAFCPALYLADASTVTVYPVSVPYDDDAAVPSQILTLAVFPFHVADAAVSCTVFEDPVPADGDRVHIPPLQAPLLTLTLF